MVSIFLLLQTDICGNFATIEVKVLYTLNFQ